MTTFWPFAGSSNVAASGSKPCDKGWKSLVAIKQSMERRSALVGTAANPLYRIGKVNVSARYSASFPTCSNTPNSPSPKLSYILSSLATKTSTCRANIDCQVTVCPTAFVKSTPATHSPGSSSHHIFYQSLTSPTPQSPRTRPAPCDLASSNLT